MKFLLKALGFQQRKMHTCAHDSMVSAISGSSTCPLTQAYIQSLKKDVEQGGRTEWRVVRTAHEEGLFRLLERWLMRLPRSETKGLARVTCCCSRVEVCQAT